MVYAEIILLKYTYDSMKQKEKLFRVLPLIALAVLLYILCSQLSYFADDWFWGTDSSFSSSFDSFSNPENPFHFYNNGRYFGNGLGFIAANHRLIRNLIMTAVLWTIITVTAKISLQTAETKKSETAAQNLMVFLCGTILLLCPKELFRESIGWSSAFMNYVVPSALYLICLNKIFSQKDKAKTDLLFFILPVLSAFFIENLSIGNTLFIGSWIIYRFIRKRKPTVNEWLYLAGSLIGLLLMFSDDGYRDILQGNPEQTYWGAETGSLMMMIETALTAFRNFISNAIVGWMVLLTAFGALSFMTAYLLTRDHADKKGGFVMLLTLMDVLIAAYFLLRKMAPSWEAFFAYTRIIEAGMAALFLFSQPVIILLLPYSERQKEKLLFSWLFAAFITAPLTIAEPLSLRVFFPTMVFLLMLYSQITCINLQEISFNISARVYCKLLPYTAGIFLLGWGYLFSIYTVIAHYEQERIKYVRYQESLGFYDTVFPTLPYADYVIVSYPWERTWQERYKKFFDLNLDMNFTIISFEEWKESL